MAMRYLHTMVRVSDLDESLRFYCEGLGLKEISRMDSEKGRFTLIFLATPEDVEAAGYPGGVYTGSKIPEGLPCVELTHNWDPEEYTGGRNFGHLAYRMDNVYDTCARLQAMGYTINRPPRDGHMAFVRSPDGISVELLQRGDNLPPQEPWASMENTGSW
ncbi:MAG: lactoylglutathione lyase [Oceanicaulis sp.]|nr:lactoylglutathione lyase [Oceanicaulis sp.]MAZ91486.1 lactoylglutathione lyase [Maricaulis sp.]MBI74895.1 lactoylglutathione lyase [Oceanicaulis sp.]